MIKIMGRNPIRGALGGRPHADKCATCRRRKVKCDAQRPSCLRCMRAGLPCEGYEKTLTFEEPIVARGASGTAELSSSSDTDSSSRGGSFRESASHSPGSNASDTSVGSAPNLSWSAQSFQMLTSPVPGRQYRVAFIDRLNQISLPVVDGDPICAQWIRLGCREAVRRGEGALTDLVLGCAMLNVSPVCPIPATGQALYQNSLPMYSRALRAFCEDLSKQMTEEQQETLALTAFFCHIFEIAANASLLQSRPHADGVGLILAWRGPEALRSAGIRTLFCEYRVMDLCHKLMQGRATFLARDEWLYPSWRDKFPQMNNPVHTLLDVALKLPGMIELFRELQSRDDAIDAMQALHHEVQQSSELVDDWQRELAMSIARRLSNGSDHEYAATGDTIPSIEMEAALMVKRVVIIHQMNLLSKISEYLENHGVLLPPTPDRCQYVRTAYEKLSNACTAMDYFFQDDLRMTGRIIYFSFFQTCLIGLPKINLSHHGTDLPLLQAYLERCAATIKKLEACGFYPWDLSMEQWRLFAGSHTDGPV